MLALLDPEEGGMLHRSAAVLVLVLALAALGWPSPARAEDAHAPAAAGPIYVPVDPLVVPLIRGSDVRRHLIFVVQLEVADAVAGARVREMMPRLRDAYLRALARLADRLDDSTPPDLERVKRGLATASGQVLGQQVVLDVLVHRSFVRRPS